MNQSKSDRILVIRLGALGDVVDSTVAVAQIKKKRPDLKIDWLVKAAFADLVSEFCDRTILFQRNLKSWKACVNELRQQSYVACLDFHGNFRSSLSGYLSGCPRRYGYARPGSKEGATLFYNNTVELPQGTQSRLSDGLCLASSFLDENLHYEPLSYSEEGADIRFANQQMDAGHDIVLVTGCSRKGFHKQWPIERWRSFLQKSPSSWKFNLIWGPGEEHVVKKIAQGMPERVRVCPSTTLKQLQALLKRSRLVIGADTGPLHMAHLLNTPTLVLFGPKDPRRYGPQFNDFRVIYRKQVCSPCRDWKCDHISCMWAIDSSSVIQNAEEILQGVT